MRTALTRDDRDDEILRQFHDEEMAEYGFAKREKMALLGKLSADELRVLLVHYGYAEKGRDAKSWSKPDMIEALAEHMVEVDA